MYSIILSWYDYQIAGLQTPTPPLSYRCECSSYGDDDDYDDDTLSQKRSLLFFLNNSAKNHNYISSPIKSPQNIFEICTA